ncbi:MAG: hypothetical protein M1365_14160, partial [Actinobacteria bacterium]|nr:hypothetical protein [Actinomycetota bacterium]
DLGLLISAPLLYLINKTIKFSKPFITTVILLIIWSIILVLLIPGNLSGAKVTGRNDQATVNTINVKISPTSYNTSSSEKKIFKDDDFGFQFLYDNDSIIYSNRADSGYLLLIALNNPRLRKLIRDKDGREYLSRDSERYFSLEVVNKDNGCPVTINDLNNGVAIKTVIDSKEVEMIEGDGAYDTHRRSICLEKEGNIYWFVNDRKENIF